jgi:hypothetical protein
MMMTRRMTSASLAGAFVLALASTATAAELRVESLGTQGSIAVGSPVHRTTAHLASPGQLAVGLAGRATRSVAVPIGCTPVAAAPQAIALTCTTTSPVMVSAVYDLQRSVLIPLKLPPGLSGHVTDIGNRWAMISAASSPDELHLRSTRLLIDWRTEHAVSLGRDDPFGASRHVDLDASSGARRLCAPIRRRTDKGVDNFKYLQLTKVGRWTLNSTDEGRSYVQRCGTRRTTNLSRVQNPVLGNDFVGYIKDRRIVYLDLRTGKRTTRAWPTSQTPALAAAGRRLIISAPEQGPSHPPIQTPTFRIYRTQ